MARRSTKTFGAEFGERVRTRREELGLSQLELAERVGMHVPRLCELERGRNPRGPAGETIRKFASALKLPVEKLLQA